MARKIEEIIDIMLAEKTAQPSLSGLISPSATAIWKLWIFNVALAILSVEKRFDLFVQQVILIIQTLKPGTPRWYVKKAKEFQYGHDLVPEQDYYDNTGISESDVAASKIIAYAAFVEEPFVRMKVAKLTGSNLAPLSLNERLAFVAYVRRFKYAGVDLNVNTITSTAADKIKAQVKIRYNPLVLNNLGERLDGTDPEPVKNGFKTYLQNLDFNGLFSIQKLEAELLKVDGVEDLQLESIQKQYGVLPFTSFSIGFVPDSGYAIIEDADLQITYEAHNG